MKDQVGKLLRKFVPIDNTNLSNAPARYMDYGRSIYAGEPNDPNNWGEVHRKLPHLVHISSDQPYQEWLRTLAHEGTHSKLLLANQKKALPELDPNIQENIKYLLEADPEFLREYLSHASEYRPYEQIPEQEIQDRIAFEEIPAYLQAIEAMSPKGQMIEKSKWAKDLFPTEKDVDNYLSAVIPEGYLRENQSKTFRPLENQRSVREKVRDWLNRIK